MPIRIKICCIGSVKEAALAVRYGASAIGLVSEMPSGPGPISEAKITEIAATVPPGIASFLLTSKQDVTSIIEQQRCCRTSTIQLVDRLITGGYSDLRDALPGISIVQVIHVNGEESIQEAVAVSHHVDAVLLDSGNQNLQIKQLGGTGRTHDWSISRSICEAVDKPVYLAGGLNPENVTEAIRQVRPFGVDVCSGLRPNGNLDERRLAGFVDAVKRA